ncbi:RNA polymerase I-specific transcription initiation factor-domain-containing protein [Hypomontagnella monticulosa]|nr:RNA polymerase I-specific transcription initiation factor-domain-containing protein [Hypomontagnella monticulosa]
MASSADESYLLADDSEDSFDEDERPNKWRGPKSTWQQLNSEEIDTSTALKEIRDRDLSIHLYNAFSLKQRHKKSQDAITQGGPAPEKDINVATGLPVQSDDWLPQRSWTAWPMRADKVPPVDDVARILLNDPDERFTVRKAVSEMPSTALEEIISGEILKVAKEKFNARPWIQPPDESDEETSLEELESEGDSENDESSEDVTPSVSASVKLKSKSKSRSRSKSIKREYTSGDKMMEIDEDEPESEAQYKRPRKRRLVPTVSTDDDLSYSLLRPSVRHILAKLDATLTVLHNTQESALNYLSESGDSETSESSRRSSRRSSSRPRSQTPTTGKKRLGRPPGAKSRSQHRGQSGAPIGDARSQNTKGKAPVAKRAGRPKKVHARLEGESDRDFAIRIARLTKRPLPVFPDDPTPEPESDSDAEDSDLAGDSGNSGDGEEMASPNRGTVRKKKKVQKHIRSPSQASSTSATGRPRSLRQNPRLGLRDWRDVLGAAALAGFPAAAVDRAARRCADLFGQSMTLHTLTEGPVTSSGRRPSLGAGKVVTYVPGMPRPPLLEEDHDEPRQWQIPIRSSSTAPGAASDDEPGPSQSRAPSRSASRSRSRAASAAPGPWVCLFQDCPRAADGEGFARRANLMRHLKLVHGWTGTPSEGGGQTTASPARVMLEEVDSEDEMHGAVHVDGFLRPIKIRQGWRGTNATEESRRGKTGYGRGRARGRGRLRGGGEEGSEADEDEREDVQMEDRSENDD